MQNNKGKDLNLNLSLLSARRVRLFVQKFINARFAVVRQPRGSVDIDAGNERGFVIQSVHSIQKTF